MQSLQDHKQVCNTGKETPCKWIQQDKKNPCGASKHSHVYRPHTYTTTQAVSQHGTSSTSVKY